MNDSADKLVDRVVLGRYRVLRALRRGGMGVVYLARSEGAAGFRRPVVIKRIVPEYVGNERVVRMFVREARILSTLRHSGIVSVIDFGEEDDAYVMVLDYVHGYDVSTWAKFVSATSGPFPVDIALHITVSALDALDYVHTLAAPDGTPHGLIHRDVTPSNVLVDVAGHVRLADFGIARSEVDATDVRTAGSSVKGKFPYLAPELFSGGTPTAGTDVYSAGVMLHELLVGRNELRASDPQATIHRVQTHVPTPIEAVRPDAPAGLGEVVARALAKEPGARFSSAAELASELRKLRPMAEHDAQKALGVRAAQDFRDPRIASHLAVRSLEERERDWQSTEPSDDGAVELAELATITEPTPASEHRPRRRTVTARPHARESTAAGARRRLTPWIVAGCAVLVAVGAVGWVIVERRDQTIVVVHSADEDAPRRRPTLHSAEVDPAMRALTSLLARNDAALRACFAQDLTGNGVARPSEVTLHVSVRPDGRVDRVEIDPPGVAGSPVETCVRGILTGARLAPRAVPYMISVPIVVEPEE